MNARNKFFIILGIIFAISLGYYLFSTPRGSDLDLIGTVDANQIIVSPQTAGRISKLLVDEGTQVKQGDLIATLDPSELEAQARAALNIWRTDYNGARPHSKLGWQTPDEFALTFHTRRALALRNAKSSAPAPAASLAHQGKANAGNELKTG